MTQPDSVPNSIITLDEIDKEIINLLRIDGRISFTEVGKRLDMPEATARYRVQRLLQSGIVQVVAWPNPEKLGTPHVMIVSLIVETGQIEAVASALEEMSEVRFVAITTGRCDIIADLFFGSYPEVTAFLEKMKRIPGILQYDSHFILKLLKAEYKYTL
jgi:Lrp/AsnC family transcriptional regulator for asnA, asnC and gidA